MENQKVFADGFIFKRRENAPDFVVGSVSVKVDEAIAFLKKHEENGWVNLDAKKSQSGTYYMELDTFKPKPRNEATAPTPPPAQEEDLPF